MKKRLLLVIIMASSGFLASAMQVDDEPKAPQGVSDQVWIEVLGNVTAKKDTLNDIKNYESWTAQPRQDEGEWWKKFSNLFVQTALRLFDPATISTRPAEKQYQKTEYMALLEEIAQAAADDWKNKEVRQFQKQVVVTPESFIERMASTLLSDGQPLGNVRPAVQELLSPGWRQVHDRPAEEQGLVQVQAQPQRPVSPVAAQPASPVVQKPLHALDQPVVGVVAGGSLEARQSALNDQIQALLKETGKTFDKLIKDRGTPQKKIEWFEDARKHFLSTALKLVQGSGLSGADASSVISEASKHAWKLYNEKVKPFIVGRLQWKEDQVGEFYDQWAQAVGDWYTATLDIKGMPQSPSPASSQPSPRGGRISPQLELQAQQPQRPLSPLAAQPLHAPAVSVRTLSAADAKQNQEITQALQAIRIPDVRPAGVSEAGWSGFKAFAPERIIDDVLDLADAGAGQDTVLSTLNRGLSLTWRAVSQQDDALFPSAQASRWMKSVPGAKMSEDGKARLVDAYFRFLLDLNQVAELLGDSWVDGVLANSEDEHIKAQFNRIMQRHQRLTRESQRPQSPVAAPQPVSPVAAQPAAQPLHPAAVAQRPLSNVIALENERIEGTGSPKHPGWLFIPGLNDSVLVEYGRANGPEFAKQKDGTWKPNFSYILPILVSGNKMRLAPLQDGLYFWKSVFERFVEKDAGNGVPGVEIGMDPITYVSSANTDRSQGPTRSRLRVSNQPTSSEYKWERANNSEGGLYVREVLSRDVNEVSLFPWTDADARAGVNIGAELRKYYLPGE